MSIVLMLSSLSSINAFSSLSSAGNSRTLNQVNSRFMGRGMTFQKRTNVKISKSRKGADLCMFMGSDGGILGIGAPEVVTILLVGYFVLGPTELFKLTKEIGKLIQNFRTLSSEASKSFETTMEGQVEIQELRKAQSELNKAFDFRRSINVDQESEAFTELPAISEEAQAAAAAAAAATATAATATTTSPATVTATSEEAAKPIKKRRRVKKKKVEPVPEETVPLYSGDIPDLDMTSAFQDEFKGQMGVKGDVGEETDAESRSRLRKERMDRLEQAQARSEQSQAEAAEGADWFSASESDIASEVLSQQPTPEEAGFANSRFASQLSGDWNQNILENEDKLSPLAQVMERLAILEDERAAATLRLDEEFQRREEIEEKFYREKRQVLETAAYEVSAAAYSDYDFGVEEPATESAKQGDEAAKDAATAVIGQKKD